MIFILIINLLNFAFGFNSDDILKFSEHSKVEKDINYLVYDSGNFFVKKSKSNIQVSDNIVAEGYYTYNLNNSGWNYLNIETTQIDYQNKNFDIRFPSMINNPLNSRSYESNIESYLIHMKGIGYLEGYLSCEEITTFYPNFYSDSFGEDEPSSDVSNFIKSNYDWVKSQAESKSKTSDYWLSIQGTLSQIDGLLLGFSQSNCGQRGDVFSLLQLLYMNAWGDLYTIQTKFMLQNSTDEFLSRRRNGDRSTRLGYPSKPHIPRDLRCSAIFRLLPDFSDILFSHVTWDSFIALGPRIFKHYKIPPSPIANNPEYRDIYFSSSPALLSSVDDFYIVLTENSASGKEATQLAVIETTNELYNPELFKLVVPTTVLSWMRVITANTLSHNGEEWSQQFSNYASGTYTNQWMILDMSLFKPGESVPSPGLFTVLEEVPGFIKYDDMSSFLYKSGYWGSYNIPYYTSVYELSGNQAACNLGIKIYNITDGCYENCPRANIFRSKYSEIFTIPDMQYMINYNDWEVDPLSEGDSCNAIACRRDLEPNLRSRYPAGGLDGKVSSVLSSSNLNQNSSPSIYGRVGPTSDDQPVFCWSTTDGSYIHNGQPDCFSYAWSSLI